MRRVYIVDKFVLQWVHGYVSRCLCDRCSRPGSKDGMSGDLKVDLDVDNVCRLVFVCIICAPDFCSNTCTQRVATLNQWKSTSEVVVYILR